jgi:hypothetical protein
MLRVLTTIRKLVDIAPVMLPIRTTVSVNWVAGRLITHALLFRIRSKLCFRSE